MQVLNKNSTQNKEILEIKEPNPRKEGSVRNSSTTTKKASIEDWK